MVASLHRIERSVTGICPAEDLEPLTLRPLEELMRIRRSAEDHQATLARAVKTALTGG